MDREKREGQKGRQNETEGERERHKTCPSLSFLVEEKILVRSIHVLKLKYVRYRELKT